VRFTFREKPHDLLAAFILSAILAPLALLGVTGPGRIVLGLIFILFIPGYVLTAALFPEDLDLDWIERIALSVGLSIAVVALIGLVLNFTPWGLFLEPVLASLLLFTYGIGTLAYWRRMKLLPMERLSLTIEIPRIRWSSYSRMDKIATVALAASLVFAAGTVVYVVVTPRPAERFTEFYILNATGVAGGYPTNLTVGQVGVVNLSVHNREFATVSYEVRVNRAVMEAIFNASANRTEYRVVSTTFLTSFTFTIANGEYWNQSYAFSFSSPGIYRIYFDLYKLPNQRDIYRYLFLTVWVR